MALFTDFQGSSDESESDDDEPDPSARREPNKFDNLCDGVTNTMAYVHGAMQEVFSWLCTYLYFCLELLFQSFRLNDTLQLFIAHNK